MAQPPDRIQQLAHDINNSLGVIIPLCQLALSQEGEKTVYLEKILQAAVRCKNIVAKAVEMTPSAATTVSPIAPLKALDAAGALDE